MGVVHESKEHLDEESSGIKTEDGIKIGQSEGDIAGRKSVPKKRRKITKECPACHKIFSSKGNLKIHIETVHEGKKSFNCSLCNTQLSSKRNLENHVAGVHEGKKPFACSQCTKSFAQNASLKHHIETVHEIENIKIEQPDEAAFLCLPAPSDSEINPESDTRKKQTFECSICNTQLSSKRNLENHISGVHDGTKSFHCSLCSKSFAQNATLKQHIKAVHEGKKPFQCEQCQLRFKTKVNLNNHIARVHSGDTPFKCSFCFAGFNSAKSLTRHMGLVHESKEPENENGAIRLEDIKVEQLDDINIKEEYDYEKEYLPENDYEEEYLPENLCDVNIKTEIE